MLDNKLIGITVIKLSVDAVMNEWMEPGGHGDFCNGVDVVRWRRQHLTTLVKRCLLATAERYSNAHLVRCRRLQGANGVGDVDPRRQRRPATPLGALFAELAVADFPL